MPLLSSSQPMRIPVTVVTGFLGAGKSTLVSRWLTELSRDETAVIINEAGEVGIDGALLRARAARLREITGGCVCCATQAELAAALAELAGARPAPARILVETSGAASPAGVVRPLTRGRAADRLRLDGIITGNLLRSLETNAPAKNRDEEAAKARARSAQRFSNIDR